MDVCTYILMWYICVIVYYLGVVKWVGELTRLRLVMICDPINLNTITTCLAKWVKLSNAYTTLKIAVLPNTTHLK